MKIYCDDIIAFQIHFERYFEIFIEMSVKIKKKKIVKFTTVAFCF